MNSNIFRYPKFIHKNIKLKKQIKPQKIEAINNSSNENILQNYEIKLNCSSKDNDIIDIIFKKEMGIRITRKIY